MKVTKQEQLLLGAFLGVVVVVTGGYIWYTTRPRTGMQSTRAVVDDVTLQDEEIRALDTVSALLDERRINSIVRSGIFDRPGGEAVSTALPATHTGIPVETTRVVEVQEEAPGAGESEPNQAGSIPSGPRVITRTLKAIDIAITGVVLGGKTVRALVYNNAAEEGKWIDVPGEAYGYQIEYVTMKGAVVSKEGRTYVLLLGANRKDTPEYPVAGTQSESTPQGPTPNASPGAGQMAPGPGPGGGAPPPGAWAGPPGGFRGVPPGGFGGGGGRGRGGRG